MRVAFLYNAQDHHILHSLPIACELSAHYPDIAVTVLCRTEDQLALARHLAALYPGHSIDFMTLRSPLFARRRRCTKRMGKFATLVANRGRLNSFDALVVPERTSLLLKRFGVKRPRYIHSFHGSSGHDRVDDPRLARFDLLLAPSGKRLDRIAGTRGLDPARTAVIGYAKLDLVRRLEARPRPLFANAKPTILYNPHHWTNKSSWHAMGRQLLDHFAARSDYNLIFAPHVRLFDPPGRHEAAFARYREHDHILVDLGSERSIDMSYTLAADVYLGDVSSQVIEFLVRPRPCIFLNPRGLQWETDPDFASWRLGRVVATIGEMDEALASRAQWQPRFEPAQRKAADQAFEQLPTPAPIRGAQAIAAFLRDGALNPGWDEALPPSASVSPPSPVAASA